MNDNFDERYARVAVLYSEEPMKAVAARRRELRELDGLRTINLAHNQIDDISDLANLKSLRFLNVMGNDIGNRGPLTLLRRQGTVVVE